MGETVIPEVVADTGGWAGVGDGDTTSDEILGPVAGTTADVDGECVACGWEIHVGQSIVLPTDGDEWIHEGCAP